MKTKKQSKSNAVAIEKSTATININQRALVESGVALLVVSLAPLLLAHSNQNQLLLGTIVNATLFLTVIRIGLINAIFISCIPSLIALSRGMLPPQTVIILPFIIFSNIFMVSAYFLFKINTYKRIFLSAVVKMVSMTIPIVIGVQVGATVAFMISWPQLLTALLGGLVALAFNSFLKGKIKSSL